MRKLLRIIFLGIITLGAGCSESNDSAMLASGDGNATGQGGSMARFAISGDHLYTVDQNKLNLFSIANPTDPTKLKDVPLGFGVETIFPYSDKLFIGTQNGMYILSIQDPATPRVLSHYSHVVSCDPVVTDGRYAYITLSTGTACRRAINELQIVDLQNISNPQLIKQYSMTNPKGLGIENNNLFVADNGLKRYDATDVMNLKLKQHFPIKAYDVIPNNGNLLVIGDDGFYQYSYANNNLELLSKIEVQ